MIGRSAMLVPVLIAVLCCKTSAAGPVAAPSPASEAAIVDVAKHLSPPYALYLYESLSRQVLSNERVMERQSSPAFLMAKDSLWALDIMSQSLLVDGQDGQYLDVRRVPPFFTDIAQRYLSPAHYWPARDITDDTRREQLAAWYSIYVMLLVANATQDEILKTLQGGIFDRPPDGLKAGGPSLVERLRTDKVLSEEAYRLVEVKRKGPPGTEALTFPPYMNEWKTKISAAYGVK